MAPIAPSAGNLAAEEKAPTLALAPFKIITLLPAELPGLHYALALFEATPSEVPSFLTSAPAWAKSLWGQLVLNPTWDTVLPWAVLSGKLPYLIISPLFQ